MHVILVTLLSTLSVFSFPMNPLPSLQPKALTSDLKESPFYDYRNSAFVDSPEHLRPCKKMYSWDECEVNSDLNDDAEEISFKLSGAMTSKDSKDWISNYDEKLSEEFSFQKAPCEARDSSLVVEHALNQKEIEPVKKLYVNQDFRD